MRRMSGSFDDRHIDRTVALLLRNLDLSDRPILVIGALDHRDRYADIGKIVRDIPGTEFRIEPGAIPAVEGIVDILVPARQLSTQTGRLVRRLDFGDGGDPH